MAPKSRDRTRQTQGLVAHTLGLMSYKALCPWTRVTEATKEKVENEATNQFVGESSRPWRQTAGPHNTNYPWRSSDTATTAEATATTKATTATTTQTTTTENKATTTTKTTPTTNKATTANKATTTATTAGPGTPGRTLLNTYDNNEHSEDYNKGNSDKNSDLEDFCNPDNKAKNLHKDLNKNYLEMNFRGRRLAQAPSGRGCHRRQLGRQ